MFMMPADAEGTYRVEVRRRHLADQASPYVGYLQSRLSAAGMKTVSKRNACVVKV